MQAVNTGLVHVIVQPADKGTNFYQLAAHTARGWLVWKQIAMLGYLFSLEAAPEVHGESLERPNRDGNDKTGKLPV